MTSNLSLRRGRNRGAAGTKAFTLVELLIVVIILGLLAAIVIPQVSNASMEARESMLRENLRTLKLQIGCYRALHGDVSPGYPQGDTSQPPTEADFVAQMTLFTDAQGNTNNQRTAVFAFGPYLREVPENPVNNSASITVIPDDQDMPAAASDADCGWIYKASDIVLRAGVPGADQDGTPYYEY